MPTVITTPWGTSYSPEAAPTGAIRFRWTEGFNTNVLDFDAPTCAAWLRAPYGSLNADSRLAKLESKAEWLHRRPALPAPGDNGLCDHSTGGSPDPYSGAAPAPMRQWVPPTKQGLSLSKAQRERIAWEKDTVPIEVAQRLAFSAAKLALRGNAFKPDDVADCASKILLGVLERARENAPTGPLDRIPGRLSSYGHLCHKAADWRDAEENRREKKAEEESRNTNLASFARAPELPADPTVGTPWGARSKAVAMLRETGQLRPGQPIFWGPVWTTAYTAARAVVTMDEDTTEVESLDPDALAEELEVTPATYRQHLSRAPGRILKKRPGTRHDYADALDLDTDNGGIALRASASRSKTINIGERAKDGGWRGLDVKGPLPAPLYKSKDKAEKWDGRKKTRPDGTPKTPEWAREMQATRPLAAARMARLAKLSKTTKKEG